MTKQLMTKKGLENLQKKLADTMLRLKQVQEEKAHAYTASGDGWHDNPGWLQLGQIEEQLSADVRNINLAISNAVIVNTQINTRSGLVQIGSNVAFTLTMPGGKKVPWQVCIGGAGESNLKEKIISYDSPIGQAIMGKKINDAVEVLLPAGKCHIQINDIS